jgi:hypothetical protein
MMDGAGEFTGRQTDFNKHVWRMWIKLSTTEQGRKNQNHAAECEIGFLARHCLEIRNAEEKGTNLIVGLILYMKANYSISINTYIYIN